MVWLLVQFATTILLAVFAVIARLAAAAPRWVFPVQVPDRMSMAGHEHGHTGSTASQSVSVAELTGPKTGTPDRSFILEAKKTTITLPSGDRKEVWTYNWQIPGPEFRVKERYVRGVMFITPSEMENIYNDSKYEKGRIVWNHLVRQA
ncbi:hypothetical protein MUG84_03485 [Paenibacillus sp. KQZ6P-2]|uniref:Uncharacterized protein n=1 Tax=Paenibacillus mangrovi TaxID=2931978 RepID=A0A9X1WLC6_9BACL|nr:hypothetical protein [Paenibacillus mangrovi]MCJ8010806.1 hypothetical protein [Paenibacillus mangrovi]